MFFTLFFIYSPLLFLWFLHKSLYSLHHYTRLYSVSPYSHILIYDFSHQRAVPKLKPHKFWILLILFEIQGSHVGTSCSEEVEYLVFPRINDTKVDFVGEKNVDNRPVWISIRHIVTKFGSKEGETHYIIIVLVGKISGQGNISDHLGMQNKVISKWGQSNGFGRWLWGPRIKNLGEMYGGIRVAHEHYPATWGSKQFASVRQHFWEFLASNIDKFFTPWIK